MATSECMTGPPPRAYLDAERYERERAAIFAKEWIVIGDRSQLGRSGDYLALSVAGFPIVVVDDEGALRGFHNICRHRAGPLVWDGGGNSRSFVCRYHGWAYGLDGSLRSARDFGQAVAEEDCSLRSVSVAEWRGLVFACLDPAAPPLEEWLGPIAGHSRQFAVESFEPRNRSVHDLAVNWKVYAENYQEGYHIPLVHPSLHKQVDASRYRVEIAGAACLHSVPTRDGSVTNGAWWWRFPGLALNLYESGMCVESFWPTGPASTRVTYAFYFEPAASESDVSAAVESSVRILEEDRVICEAVQRNLASGLAGPGRLSPRHEHGVALVHALVDEALAAPAPAPNGQHP